MYLWTYNTCLVKGKCISSHLIHIKVLCLEITIIIIMVYTGPYLFSHAKLKQIKGGGKGFSSTLRSCSEQIFTSSRDKTFRDREKRREMEIKSPTVKFRPQRQQIQNEPCVKDPLPALGGHFHRNFLPSFS